MTRFSRKTRFFSLSIAKPSVSDSVWLRPATAAWRESSSSDCPLAAAAAAPCCSNVWSCFCRDFGSKLGNASMPSEKSATKGAKIAAGSAMPASPPSSDRIAQPFFSTTTRRSPLGSVIRRLSSERSTGPVMLCSESSNLSTSLTGTNA